MLCKKVRLGKDAEVGTTNNGKTIMKLSGVYDIGYGNNKRSQWIGLVQFGESVGKVAQHLTKGKEIVIYAEDIEAKEHNGKAYLNGVVRSFDFVSDGQQQAPQQGYQQGYQQAPQQAPQAAPASNFDDFDDDIPFN